MISHAQTIDSNDHCYVMRNNDKNIIFLQSEKIHNDHVFSKILKDKNVSYSSGEVVCLCITGANNLEYIMTLDSKLNLVILRLLFSSSKDVSVERLEPYLHSIEEYVKKEFFSGYSSTFLNECKVKIMLYTPQGPPQGPPQGTSQGLYFNQVEDVKTSLSSMPSISPFFPSFIPSAVSKYQASEFRNIGKFLSPKVKWNLHTYTISFD